MREVSCFELELGLEHLTLRAGQIKLRERHHLAGALADTHVADAEFTRIAPVAVVVGVNLVKRHGRQVIDHLAKRALADPRGEVVEALRSLASGNEASGDAPHHFRNVLGRHRADGEPVGAAVVDPLAAQHHLEVGDHVTPDVPAYPVEPEVADVVLPAGVEAAADLDA